MNDSPQSTGWQSSLISHVTHCRSGSCGTTHVTATQHSPNDATMASTLQMSRQVKKAKAGMGCQCFLPKADAPASVPSTSKAVASSAHAPNTARASTGSDCSPNVPPNLAVKTASALSECQSRASTGPDLPNRRSSPRQE